MKPGMQRDLLVAFWFLFDEFEIGDDTPGPATTQPGSSPPSSPTDRVAPAPGADPSKLGR